MQVFNLLGQNVAVLEGGVRSAGIYTSEWNAAGMASGIYFYKIEAVGITRPDESFTQIKKMLLMR